MSAMCLVVSRETPGRAMDLRSVVSDFIDELLGARSAYSLHDLGELNSAGEVAALTRLRLRIAEAFMAEGWRPTESALVQLETDRRSLADPEAFRAFEVPSSSPSSSAADERADGRARAGRARAESRQAVRESHDARAQLNAYKRELDQMRQALESRAVIEQAKGVAMERYSLTVDTAWSWLVRMSQQQNAKVRAVAHDIVASAVGPRESAESSVDGQQSMDGNRKGVARTVR